MYGGKIIKEWEEPTGDNVHDIHVNMGSVAYVERPKSLDGVYIATFVSGKSIYIDAYTYNQMSRWIDERCQNYENYGWPVDADGKSIHIGDHMVIYYHEPTVDDLLFSYGQACIRANNEAETEAAKQTMLATLRHEYAAKLRMAGNGKEQQ